MKVLRRFVLLYRGLRSVVRVVEGLKRVGHAEIWTLNPRIWNPEYKRILILAFGTTVSQSVSQSYAARHMGRHGSPRNCSCPTYTPLITTHEPPSTGLP